MTRSSLILTLIGPDRPGLVRTLAELVAGHGGTWLESRMARLAGQFAGIVEVGIGAAEADTLTQALAALEAEGLRVVVQRGTEEQPRPPETTLVLDVVGNDRPGIVRDVTRVLVACGVNIEDLTTGVQSASFSGEPLFRATARLHAPEATTGRLRSALEALGNELMVDIKPAEEGK